MQQFKRAARADSSGVVGETLETAGRAVSRGTVAAATESRQLAYGLQGLSQVVFANGFARQINDLIQGSVKGHATVYDKAMDAVYNATSIGGGDHRLFDGGHTLWGAWKAAHDALPDDSVLQESLGFLLALLRDGSTPKGLPIVNWDQATLYAVNERLTSVLPIPKEWLKDLVSYDSAEVLGTIIAIVAIIYKWNSEDTEEFSRLASGIGLASILSGNPVLLVFSLVALGRAFQVAHKRGDWRELVDGSFMGLVTAGAAFAVVTMMPGPIGVAIVTALVVGIFLSKVGGKVSVTDITHVIVRHLRALARVSDGVHARGHVWHRRIGPLFVKSHLITSSRARLPTYHRLQAHRRLLHLSGGYLRRTPVNINRHIARRHST